MNSKVKVKGLLKGLRYISQIFENEKEQDIQIGFPTDVKHVAHIGWDGPSVNSPSWMNEYKTTPGFSSAPLSLTEDAQNKAQDSTVKWISEDSRRRSSQGQQGRDLPELPKASRRQTMSSSNPTDSPTREKSKQSRKSTNKQSQLKDSSNGPKSAQSTDQNQENGSPAQNLPKKSRRKKSKENSTSSGSSKLRSKAQSSDPTLDFGSPSKARNKQISYEENVQYERGVSRLS